MKNRFGKRIISILLSAMMVISMIPTFAITALAVDSSGNMSEFLTSKETLNDGITNNGVTWDDTMDGASFDGSDSVKLNTRPLKGVTQSSGFIISMDVYNTDAGLANKYLHFTNGSQDFSVEGSSPDWWTRYRTEISNGSNTRGYYTSDFTSGDYCNPTGSANGNDSYPVNEWYTLTLVMNTDGSYSYYRNGDLLATFKSNYISTGNGGGLTDESAASVISGLTDYYIGASDSNGTDGFTGYIKNVRICDNVKALDLILAMKKYEHKIDGTIYKNMAPAYNAYVAANKALDSFFYGGSHNTVTEANLATLTTNLNTAMNNMTVWTQQGARVTQVNGVFAQDSANGDYGDALHNLLYVQTGLTVGSTYCNAYVANGSDPVKKELYYPQATLLYVDENSDATFPIMLRLYSDSGNKDRYALTAFQNSGSNWALTKKSGDYVKWFGPCGGNLDYSYAFNGKAGGYLNATGTNNSSFSTSHTYQTEKNNWYGATRNDGVFANYITYTGTMSDSTAYDTILPDFMVYCNSANSWKTDDGLSGNVKGGVGNSNNYDGVIHVINYGRLINKINSYASSAYGADISKYKQNRLNGSGNSVSDYFTKLDALTNFDLHSYFTSSNDWNGCQSDMTSAINGMNNQSLTADDNGNYSALRNAINYEGVIAKLGDGVAHSVYEMATVADGEDTYSNYSAFSDAYDAATAHMAAINGGSYAANATPSTLATNLINAFNNLGIKGAEEPSISGDETFISSSDTVTITNNDTNGAEVFYTVAYDGEDTPSVSGSFSEASKTISVFGGSTDYGTAVVSAWAFNDPSTSSTVTKSFINEDYEAESLVYRESFDDASVIGSNFDTGSSSGTDGTLANDGTISVEASTGAAYDKRNSVLKINAATAASRGNYLQLENPLSKSVNAAYAKANGVTVSFWRHMNADCGRWLNAVNFTSYDTDHTDNRFKYATITATGALTFVQRDNNGGNAENGGWLDYFPHDNDITNHSASSNTGFWTNIVLTVNPKKTSIEEAIIIYINGEPHNISSTLANAWRQKGGSFENMTDAEVVASFLDFITDKNTHFDFGYGGYDEGDKSLDMWLDDIRIYTEPLTQVAINNMYTDALNDAKASGVDYQSSTSHDPTNVTVYTLKSAVATDNGTKAAGSQVGQEFIDYYNVPSSNYSVEYYSFGTGLTVYKSTDNLNWTVLGDSEGRCGYQNEELFVSASGEAQSYLTSLSEPLEWAAQGRSINGEDVREGAAGKLVWAPHVMYNLTQDKWMYYGSTSAWVSNYSAVFLLTSDFVDHGYKYQEMIVKTHGNDHEEGSTDPTNAIDSCVYYGHNQDGSIDKNTLYCLYGSWGDIMVKQINADGTRRDAVTDFGTLLSVARGGGEGGYMTYRADSNSSTGGYYYYFISPGANGWAQDGGAYHIRTYRSENPTSGFVSVTGTSATEQTDPHGNAMITAYENEASNYQYRSIGHSSVYTAYNGYGEQVFINAAHTREFSKDNKPVEDGQLSTRQIWLVGNEAIHNPVAYTSNGWPTAFPKLYDNTFSLHNKGANSSERNYFTVYDIDGVYSSNTMSKDGSVAPDEIYKIFAINSTTGVIVDDKTATTHTLILEHTDDATYMHIKNNDGSDFGEGVVANQGTEGQAVPMFSFLPENGTDAGYHVWGIKTGENPTAEELQEELEKPIEEFTSISGEAYYKGVVATDGYSNAIYSTRTTAEGNQLDKFYQYMRMYLPTETVLVYDGITTPSAPAVFSNLANGNRNQLIKYVSSSTNGLAFTKNWQGTVTDAAEWPGSRTATDNFGYDSSHASNSGTQNDSSSTRYWWNNLYYTGNGNTSTYYDKFTNPTFHVAGAYGNTNEEGDLPSPESTIYVINYKPIIDILDGTTKLTGTNLSFKDVYQDVVDNKYTPTSTMQYYRAMELVMGVNPTNAKYNYAGGAEAAVQAFTADMQQALNVFSIVDLQERADFSELDAAYAQADQLLMSMDGNAQPIYTESSVSALKNAAEAAQSTVAFDAEKRADTAKTEQNSIDTKAQAILDAIANLESAPTDEIETYQELVKTTTLAVDRDAYDISQSDLDDVVAVATDSISETVTYTSADGTESTISVVKNDSDTEDVEGATSAIMSTLTTNVKKYEITLVGDNSEIVGFSGNGWAGVEDGKQYATFNSVVNFESDDENTAWSMEYKSATVQRGKQFQSYGKTFSTRVLGDLKVWAVNAETNEEKPYKVSIQRVYSDKEGVLPVQSIDFTGSEFTLPDAPAILGYTFSGYTLDQGGENATISGNTVSGIDKDIQIAANYTRNEGEELYSVKVIGTDNVTEIYNETHLYNDKVTVDVSNAYAYVERIGNSDKFRPYFICPEGTTELTFYVSESIELRAVNASQYAALELTTLPTININQSEARTVDNGGKNKTYFNGQFVPSVSSDIQIVEYGFLVAVEKTADKLNAEDVVIENAGDSDDYRIIRAKSTKDVGAHQFTIAVNGLSGKIIYRGYIKYQSTGGNIETVYTDTQTINI